MRKYLDYLSEKYKDQFNILKKNIESFPTVKNSTSTEDCLFLSLVTKELKPKRILEIGTFVGKSTYALNIACEQNNQNYLIDTIDIKNNIDHDRFKLNKNIKFHIGHSREILKKLKYIYDLIFIDGNLDIETTKSLMGLCSSETVIILHDFVPPYDKGISNLTYLMKFADKKNCNNFSFFCPTIPESYQSEIIQKLLKNQNALKDFKITNKVNLCSAIIFFDTKYLNKINCVEDKYNKNIFFDVLPFFCFIFFILEKYILKKKNYFLFKIFNYFFIFNKEDYTLYISIKKNKFIFIKNVFYLRNYENIKVFVKKILKRNR